MQTDLLNFKHRSTLCVYPYMGSDLRPPLDGIQFKKKHPLMILLLWYLIGSTHPIGLGRYQITAEWGVGDGGAEGRGRSDIVLITAHKKYSFHGLHNLTDPEFWNHDQTKMNLLWCLINMNRDYNCIIWDI